MCRRGAAASRAASMRIMASPGGKDAAWIGAGGVCACPRRVRARSVDEGGWLGHGGSKGASSFGHLHGGVAKCHGRAAGMHNGEVQRGQGSAAWC